MDQHVHYTSAGELFRASRDHTCATPAARELMGRASLEIDELRERLHKAEGKHFCSPGTPTFQPKGGGPRRYADLHLAAGSGWDLVLFIDQENPTDDSGWMLEFSINPDGSVTGSITSRPGHDPFAVFISEAGRMTICDEYGDTGEHYLGVPGEDGFRSFNTTYPSPDPQAAPFAPAGPIIAPEVMSGLLANF